eukprot:TRINITY_DN48781_c0_g1_i1.p1 TRINITY_DN48781_c0_g1~~TRINITY_DN48781_c0_g1_i1.p1  ORF type:complete len:872 (+),score=96.22 TRINITY_DN48781_c0_g1_i1:48-2663(+)
MTENSSKKVIPVNHVSGLSLSSVSDELWKPALNEANVIFKHFCCEQFGSNQKFFLNLPFPLSGDRELGTAIFRYGDDRVTQIEKIVRYVYELFGLGKSTTSAIERANVIVREYKPGQKISFHSDDELCGPAVFGIVLENGHPKKGLIMRKGGGSAGYNSKNSAKTKVEDEFVMEEHPGTVFLMEENARYQWQHGLTPCPSRRVSITVRFFKRGVDIESTGICYEEKEEEREEHAEVVGQKVVSEKITVTIIKNNEVKVSKPVVIDSVFTKTNLNAVAKAKLRLKGKVAEQKFYLLHGKELEDGDAVDSNTAIYVAEKNEVYKGPVLTRRKEDSTPRNDAGANGNSAFVGAPCGDLALQSILNYAENTWTKWRYPKLRFFFWRRGTECDNEVGVPVTTTQALGDLIEQKSHLSVPECRELVQEIESVFGQSYQEDRDPGWRFYSCLWDYTTGKSSSEAQISGEIGNEGDENEKIASAYSSINPRSPFEAIGQSQQQFKKRSKNQANNVNDVFKTGRMVGIIASNFKNSPGTQLDFRVEGARPLKGDKKRDGPLWKLNGGLNNSGGEPQDSASSKQFKNKSTYQRQRGVFFSSTHVYFGGATFLSTYYHVKQLIIKDHRTIEDKSYSSAAQYVMSEQARIFSLDLKLGDNQERILELEGSNNAAAPHKLFDHKAPKTDERRLDGYDKEVWKRYRDDVMYKATLEKFRQNKDVRQRLLMIGPHRRVVEATGDPFWGSGIVLGGKDFDNLEKWTGLNNMGSLLDLVAAQIRREFADEAREVDENSNYHAVCSEADTGGVTSGEEVDESMCAAYVQHNQQYLGKFRAIEEKLAAKTHQTEGTKNNDAITATDGDYCLWESELLEEEEDGLDSLEAE